MYYTHCLSLYFCVVVLFVFSIDYFLSLFQTTRLGKHVNMIRRKIVDEHKTLAKRLKKLVKQWQQLLQNKTPNGLSSSTPAPSSKPSTTIQPSLEPSPPSTRTPTPKPMETDKSINNEVQSPPVVDNSPTVDDSVPITSSSSPPAAQPLRQTAATNFARNRIKMMQMLSSVKKPSVQSTQPQQTQQNEQQQQQTQQQQQQGMQQQQAMQQQQQGLQQQRLQPQQHQAQPQQTLPTGGIKQEQTQVHKAHPHKQTDRPTTQGTNAISHISIPAAKFNVNDNGQKLVSPLSSIAQPSVQTPPTKAQSELPTSSQALHKDSTAHVPSKPHSLNSALVATTGKEMGPERRSPSPMCLVVSIPQNVLKLQLNHRKLTTRKTDDTSRFYASRSDSSNQEFSMQDQRNKVSDLNFTVSIRTCLLERVPSCPSTGANMLKYSDSKIVSHCSKLDMTHTPMGLQPLHGNTTKQFKNNLSDSDSTLKDLYLEHRQSSRSLMPTGALQGVDGCVGEDGTWYTWSDTIPGKNMSVTVLPYVYFDGFDNGVHDISADFDQ